MKTWGFEGNKAEQCHGISIAVLSAPPFLSQLSEPDLSSWPKSLQNNSLKQLYHSNFLITNLIPQEFIFVIDVIALRHKFP